MEDGVVFSDELPHGLKVNVNGILIIGTKTEEEKQAG